MSNPNDVPVGPLLRLYYGCAVPVALQLKEADGSPMNLTSPRKAYLQVGKFASTPGVEPPIEVLATPVGDPTAGAALVSVTATDDAIAIGANYRYQVRIMPDNYPALVGPCTVEDAFAAPPP